MPRILAALDEDEEEEPQEVPSLRNSTYGRPSSSTAAPPNAPPIASVRTSRLGRQASSTHIGLPTVPSSDPPAAPPPAPLPSPPAPMLEAAGPQTPKRVNSAGNDGVRSSSTLTAFSPGKAAADAAESAAATAAGSMGNPMRRRGTIVIEEEEDEESDEPPGALRNHMVASTTAVNTTRRKGSIETPTEQLASMVRRTSGDRSGLPSDATGSEGSSYQSRPPGAAVPDNPQPSAPVRPNPQPSRRRQLAANPQLPTIQSHRAHGSNRSLPFGSGLSLLSESQSQAGSMDNVVVNAKPKAEPHWEAVNRARYLVRNRNADVLAMVGAYDPFPAVWEGPEDVMLKRQALGRPVEDLWQRQAEERFPRFPETKLGPGTYLTEVKPHESVNAGRIVFKSRVPRFIKYSVGTAQMTHIGPGVYSVSRNAVKKGFTPWVQSMSNNLGRMLTTVGKAPSGPELKVLEQLDNVEVPKFTGARKQNETPPVPSHSSSARTKRAPPMHPLSKSYIIQHPPL
ncbi:hypothetical protein DFJ73DRAFT_808656 [Zopfochytrium polystomum]|nr:hypothetical protein DFJ73DRAFT_808656 [Zopfochytrium polystomum]